MSRKLVIIFRLVFYLTYFLNNNYNFLIGYPMYVFNIIVFILFVFDVIEVYKKLKLEKIQMKVMQNVTNNKIK